MTYVYLLYYFYVIIHVWNFQRHLQIADRRAPDKIANSAENSVLQALHFHQMCARRKLPGGTGISDY
jgi:hypothetical protein